MIVAVATVTTVEIEPFVTAEIGVGILRQSQALEIAEEATAVNHVGIDGLALGWIIPGTASESNDPRRARACAVVVVGFPGSKMIEVLAPISMRK